MAVNLSEQDKKLIASDAQSVGEKEKVLEVKDLRISFKTDNGKVQAVRGVSFDLYKEETLCIVGESGSGKSVTSKAIMGILSANAIVEGGNIIYQGEDLLRVSEEEFHRIRGHKIGMIFQDPLSSLNPIVKIGKQIIETMMINSNQLKNRYNDLISKELTAYKNAKVIRDTEISAAQNEYNRFVDDYKAKIAEQNRLINDNKEAILDMVKAKSLSANLEKFKAEAASLQSQYDAEKAKGESNALTVLGNKLNKANLKVEQATAAAETCKDAEAKKAELEKSSEAAKATIASLKAELKAADKAEKAKIAPRIAAAKAKYKEEAPTLKAALATRKKEAKAELKVIKADLIKTRDEKLAALDKEIAAYHMPEEQKKELDELNAKIKKLNASYKWKTTLLYFFAKKKRKILDKQAAEMAPLLKKQAELAAPLTAFENKRTAINEEYQKQIKITRAMAKKHALEVMREVGIPQPEKRFYQYPFQFSGGMRQRIVIAIALTAAPDILICDEPTTALDVTIQAQILELINKLKAERHLSCIFITHDLGVVANMADRVAVMYAGKIAEYGLSEEIFFDPRHPYTWALLSSIPDIDSKEKLEAIPGTPPDMIYPPKGDAFALRNKYALGIDFKYQPPYFKISDTHYAATWLEHENAPHVEPSAIVSTRIKKALAEEEENRKHE